MHARRHTRLFRVFIAGALVAALVSCGGSGDSGTRNRNSALDECTTDSTVANGNGNGNGNGQGNGNGNGKGQGDTNGQGNGVSDQSDCVPDSTFATAADQPIECKVQWDPAQNLATFCRDFNKFEVVQYDDAGNEIDGGKSNVESEAGGNSVQLTLSSGATKAKVTIYLKNAKKDLKKMGVVEFVLATSNVSTFEYVPLETGTTDTTMPASSDSTMPAASDTTMPAASDTTMPAASDTTAPAVSDTTTPAAPESIPQNNPDTPQPIVVQKTECGVSYTAEELSLSMCEGFDWIYVAMYDEDGTYAGKVEGSGGTITLDKAIVDAGGAKLLRIEVANKIGDTENPVFVGDGWMTIGDGKSDSTGAIQIDKTGTWINDTGWDASMWARLDGKNFQVWDWWEGDRMSYVIVDGQLYNEMFGNIVLKNYDGTSPVTWKAYVADGMGLPRLVATGVANQGVDTWTNYFSPSFELDKETVAFLEGLGEPTPTDTAVQVADDPCKDISPFMITDPGTPSKKSMVTVTIDSDCKSPNHLIGGVILGWGWFPVWSQFLQTKYTQRIQETVFLPDGFYIMAWGSWNLGGWHEFIVNSGNSSVDCSNAHMRLNAAEKTGTILNCNPGNKSFDVWAGKASHARDEDWGDYVKLPRTGNTVSFADLTFTGPFYVYIAGEFFAPGLMGCLTECDYPSDGQINVDQSGFDGTGHVSSTITCNPQEGEESWGDTAYWRGYRDGYAYEWDNWSMPGDQVSLNQGGEVLVTGYCSYWKQTDEDNWYYAWTTSFSKTALVGNPPGAPANDNIANAAVIPAAAGSFEVNTVGATAEDNEPRPWWSLNIKEKNYASAWFKMTPTKDAVYNLKSAGANFFSSVRVFRATGDGRLGLVGFGWFWRYWMDGPAITFGVKTGVDYYIQVYGDWARHSGEMTLVLNDGYDKPMTLTSDGAGSPDTTAAGAPDTTPDTVPSGGMGGGFTKTTTPVTPSDEEVATAYNDALKSATKVEEATVLAPSAEQPATVEVREDTTIVEMPVIDLYSTAGGGEGGVAKADLNKPVTVMVKDRKPVTVFPGQKSVQIPVSAAKTDMTVMATDTSGKPLTAPLQVKKVAKPLVAVASSSSSSSFPVLWVIIAVLVIAILAVVARKRRPQATPAE